MRAWIAVVVITDKGRDNADRPAQLALGATPEGDYYHSVNEIQDALEALGDCPVGLSYTFKMAPLQIDPNLDDGKIKGLKF